MAGFLKTEENRRLAVSAGSAAVVYILLFLFFAVYFAVGRREPQSFGASAVLIYGVPMGELSQPRNLVGGHVISALVGVIAYHLFPDNVAFASALAVATAIAAMMATNTTLSSPKWPNRPPKKASTKSNLANATSTPNLSPANLALTPQLKPVPAAATPRPTHAVTNSAKRKNNNVKTGKSAANETFSRRGSAEHWRPGATD